MSLATRYDAVVIGAGVGGLMAAAILARRGLHVLVAEQSPAVGGCCSAFRVDGYRFDAAVHHVSGGGRRSLLGQALGSVGARVELVPLDPMDTLVWPDLRFEIPAGWEPLIEASGRAFPRQRLALRALFAELMRLYRAVVGTPGGEATLERWSDRTFLELLGSFVDDERLLRVLSGQWGYLGAPPQRLSAVGMCQMLVNYWRDGAHYPRGGTQAIPDALATAVRAAGGMVCTSTGVRRILVAGGRAAGVVLATGTVVRAPLVVSNVDVPQTIERLLEGAVDPDYHAAVAALEVSAPFFLLYLGLGPGFTPARLRRGFYHLKRRLGGPWLYVSSATEVDPRLAPRGRHAVTVVVSLDQGEASVTDWHVRKEEKARATLAQLDTIAAGLQRHVEVVRAAHPPLPTRRTASYCGAPYGWAVIPSQSGRRRLAQRTPIAGLHLAGHWTTPGPGVCAVLASGWRAANEALLASAPAPTGAL